MVSFFLVYLVTILYCSDIVWSKDLSAYFFCFLPIFDREFSFLSFLLSKARMGIFHPGSRFMVSWDFGSRLVERLDMKYVKVLVWPAVQG